MHITQVSYEQTVTYDQYKNSITVGAVAAVEYKDSPGEVFTILQNWVSDHAKKCIERETTVEHDPNDVY